MTFIIVQNCCNDASCVGVCPVDCIHPTPDEPDFGSAEMLYINPADCIDCGACVDACPVEAIYADYDLPGHLTEYEAVNEGYFAWMGPPPVARASVRGPRLGDQTETLRVAVVGAGPSGWYVTEALIGTERAKVEVTVIDRLPFSHGLVRYGVAPDHEHTKAVGDLFDRLADSKKVHVMLGVEVGKDLTHEELLAHHHAVVYCTGAGSGRTLGIPGEGLGGVTSSAEFVQWYNGHPDFADRMFDLSGERAVVIGNGNVALDIARLLLTSPDDLATTDMAEHALDALSASGIREVVILGRRGPEHAAFSSPELRALLSRRDLDVVLEGPAPAMPANDATAAGFAAQQKALLLRDLAGRARRPGKRLVLRFNSTPIALEGDDRVRAIRLRASSGEDVETLDAGLVISATGFRSEGVDGLPFDSGTGRFRHQAGRIEGDDQVLPGTYTAGWVKRGPSGVIGTNKVCAAETATSLLDDAVAGELPNPIGDPTELAALLAARGVQVVDAAGWQAIRAHEVAAGRKHGRPRLKLSSKAPLGDLISQTP